MAIENLDKKTLTGVEASILTLLAESPGQYKLDELEDDFGPLRQEVRDIAAVLLGDEDHVSAAPNELRRGIRDIAEQIRRGVDRWRPSREYVLNR